MRSISKGLPGLLALCLLAGCAARRPHFDRALMAETGAGARSQGVSENYAVHCPDVLAVSVAGRPELTGECQVGSDGRIDLGKLGRLRVEGRNLSEIRDSAAQAAGVSPEQVSVRVAEFNSQQIYLYGQVIGLQRAVPYQGQETVLDLLQRVGGITRGAASNDVYVVRPRAAEGMQPEVFHIALSNIVAHQDQHTNLRLQPFDEVYVGETRKSSLEKCLPPCLRPAYKALCGLSRPRRLRAKETTSLSP